MSKVEPEIHLPPPLKSRPHVVQASQSGTPMRNFSEEDSNKEACKTISDESGGMSHIGSLMAVSLAVMFPSPSVWPFQRGWDVLIPFNKILSSFN